MKVYKVESDNYSCRFFDIVCANSEKEAIEVAFEYQDNGYLDISDLEAEELEDLSANLEEPCLITGAYID